VALVTINRTKSERFPSTICGVVYQKSQFSWTKNYAKVKINAVQWQQSKDAAMEAYMNNNILGKFTATHFHNLSVNPGWKLRRVAKIGNHIFYSAT
jgi:spore germination cell wall hydrolase CwlJ-like protein